MLVCSALTSERDAMNRRVLGCIAVAGLASACSAQGVTLIFSADTTSPNIGATIGWTVFASFTGFNDPSAYFGGFAGTFLASDQGLGTVSNFQNLMAGTGTAPVGSGADLNSINIFNAALLGTDDQENPLEIFRFDLTMTNEGTISYDAFGTATVFPNDGVLTLGETFTDINVISDEIFYLPAPGAAVGFGSGLLFAGCRRRA